MASARSRLIRRIVYVLVALVIVGFIITRFLQPKSGPQYTTVKVENGDVQQTVALTGTTEPLTRYQLQFNKTARLGEVRVHVGDLVKSGDVLAVLENKDAQLQLDNQKAVLRIAQANLAKAVAKQRPEELKLSQLKINLAQMDAQNSEVAKQNLLELAQRTVNSADIALQTARTNLQQAQDQYNGAFQAVPMANAQQPVYGAFDTGYYYGDLRTALSPTGTTPSAGSTSLDMSQNSIYTAQYNLQKAQQAYGQAEQNYEKAAVDFQRQNDDTDNVINKSQVALESAVAQAQLSNASPREVDVAPLKAQVDQAWVGVHLGEYQLDQTQLKAPSDGLVTEISIDAGENVSPTQPLITLDSNSLSIKALVSEADIAKIKIGQNVDLSFDAFGTTKMFIGNVAEMDPSETIVQGVVYYVVKVQFNPENQAVRPGMTANLTIQTDTQKGALKIPARAVQYNGNQAYVQVLKTVSNKQEVEKRNVEVGLQGDEDVQILSGLQVGDEVVTFTKV